MAGPKLIRWYVISSENDEIIGTVTSTRKPNLENHYSNWGELYLNSTPPQELIDKYEHDHYGGLL